MGGYASEAMRILECERERPSRSYVLQGAWRDAYCMSTSDMKRKTRLLAAYTTAKTNMLRGGHFGY